MDIVAYDVSARSEVCDGGGVDGVDPPVLGVCLGRREDHIR